ncbi:MAG TPA: tRNA preQ1(34) S-adenosylmethionine ribosyltransferase-isomerase QueA, partial [Steroidobacteraceae bacterium]|nr:tRNA preQ1(34) S-adenosylmethionine ribosyltransferase-isomerase QueA [Steroidobacteraceae bacterium]
MLRSDFQYELPEELIARFPAVRRSDSRLLHLDGGTGALADRRMNELPALLRAGDLLVFNDTRVIPARLFGRKDTGGRIEVLLERIITPRRALVQLRASKPPRAGGRLHLEPTGESAAVLGREGEFWLLEFGADTGDVFARLGTMPLPPYLDRPVEETDFERYQTVFARRPGAVAAPTAGLHFDSELLQALGSAGVSTTFVTLHVGAGTFQPVRAMNLAEHQMHMERLTVGAEACAAIDATRRRGGRVVAVGTTSVRALETAGS